MSHMKVFEHTGSSTDLTFPAATILLTTILAIALSFIAIRANALVTIGHDDGISLLAATAHQRAWVDDLPEERWVPARDVKAFIRPEAWGRFVTIRTDLAERDIHPPLYFWILHVWIFLTSGIGLATGPALNAIFHIGTTIALFAIGRRLGCTRLASLTAAALWALNGSSLAVPTEVRQYSLLAMAVAALLYAGIAFTERSSWRTRTALGAAVLLGFLVHFQFAVLAALTGMTLAAVLYARGDVKRIVEAFACFVAGFLVFVALHPRFWVSLTKRSGKSEGIASNEIVPGTSRFLGSLFELALPPTLATSLTTRFWLAALVVFVLVAACAWIARRRAPGALRENLLSIHSLPAWLFALVVVSMWGLYVSGATPRHAVGPRYISLASPILFTLIAQLFDGFARTRLGSPLLAATMLYAIALGAMSTSTFVSRERELRAPAFDASTPVLIDTTARGVVPTLVWHLDDETPVYLALQNDILDTPPDVSAVVRRLFYVSSLENDKNSIEKREAILGELRVMGFQARELPGGVYGVGNVFELTR